jgi:1-acyl-sn-glycerol-3-phosphate acyltransferase
MRSWCYYLCQAAIRMGGSFFWQVRTVGLENVPRSGGALLAANHQSYLDPPLIGAYLPREMHFMARRTLFRNPLFGAIIGRLNAFAIERDTADVKGVKNAIERLQRGNLLLVFPEGTRTRDGTVGRMKAGIGTLAERAAVPIVPVLIVGARDVWPKGAVFPRLGRISIVYGRPMAPELIAGDGMRNAVVALKGELKGCRTVSS